MTDSRPVNEMSGRHETEAERLDRNFGDLLQELRVAQAGTQILFAFLLTVAFQPYIQDAGAFEQRLLAATLVFAALATVLLIAPVPLHRMMFRQQRKETIVSVSSRLASAGLALLLLAMLGGCLLALDALLTRTTAYVVTAGVAVWFAVFWLVVPFGARVLGRRSAT